MTAASTIISTSCSAGTSPRLARGKGAKKCAKANDNRRDEAKALRRKIAEAEAATQRLTALCAALDLAMADPAKAAREHAKLSMSELAKRRAAAGADLEAAEAHWLEVSEQLETLAA